MKERVPYKALCLVDRPSWPAQLPRYNNEPEPSLNTTNLSDETRKFQQEHKAQSLAAQTVAMCLQIAIDDNETTFPPQPKEENYAMEWLNEEEEELVTEAWTRIHDKMEWNEWTRLYQLVRTNLVIVYDPVVSTTYATHTVFSLTPDELCQACQVLHEQTDDQYHHVPSTRNAHALSQVLQDDVTTCPYAVLVDPPAALRSNTFQHSCLPNIALDCNISSTTVQWIALYDLQVGEEVTVSLVDASLPHKERQLALKERYGPSFVCQCVKCTQDDSTPSIRDMQRLGHVALQEEHYDAAREWYQRALVLDNTLADIWHALGAIPLQQKRFVEAQRVWQEAVSVVSAEKHSTHHVGIALQLEKSRAYRYFDRKSLQQPPLLLPAYTDVFSSGLCFVTKDPILSSEDCQQVIDWAKHYYGEEWTTNRHYAVPTNDVPVHRVPPLLQWFVTWMETSVYHLLANQFGLCANHFYVHDAFVVQYKAVGEHNHLPLHYDESTHSLVLALNDDGFEGGGTYFCCQETIVNPKQGTLVSFRGDRLRHGGNIVTKGVRYILTVFLYYDPDNEKTSLMKKRTHLGRVLETSKKSKFSFEFSLSHAETSPDNV